MMNTPSVEELRALFEYEPATGILWWRKNRRVGGTPGGVKAGTKSGGYIRVRINQTFYRAHRIIWTIVYGIEPAGGLDHIDGDGCNNLLSNLRLATHAENARNSKHGRTKSSPFKGVYYDRRQQRWRARIMMNGISYSLGQFQTAEDAAEARKAKALELHGEFAR